jgi:hypothetical protein
MAKNEKKKPKQITEDAILTAEFGYIAQATFQANEDRARVTNFYLITLGTFIAAIFSNDIPISQSFGEVLVNIGFGLLFTLVSIQGILTLLQLARLRGAWFESVAAMNQIKSYYEERFPTLEKAFRWRDETLPSRFKRNSVGYYLALQVALLSGITLSAAFGEFLSPVLSIDPILIICLVVAVVSVFILMRVYRRVVES